MVTSLHFDIVAIQDLLQKSNLKDASGNVIFADFGVHIQRQVSFKTIHFSIHFQFPTLKSTSKSINTNEL